MDRNIIGCPMLKNSVVALRKESVDRNCNPWDWFFTGTLSLSARRAWIEIFIRPISYLGRFSRSPQGERG